MCMSLNTYVLEFKRKRFLVPLEVFQDQPYMVWSGFIKTLYSSGNLIKIISSKQFLASKPLHRKDDPREQTQWVRTLQFTLSPYTEIRAQLHSRSLTQLHCLFPGHFQLLIQALKLATGLLYDFPSLTIHLLLGIHLQNVWWEDDTVKTVLPLCNSCYLWACSDLKENAWRPSSKSSPAWYK